MHEYFTYPKIDKVDSEFGPIKIICQQTIQEELCGQRKGIKSWLTTLNQIRSFKIKVVQEFVGG